MKHSLITLLSVWILTFSGSQQLCAGDQKPETASQESHEPIIGSWVMGNGRTLVCNKLGQADLQGVGVGKWKKVGDSLKYEASILGHGKFVITVSKDSQTVDGYWQTLDKQIKNASGNRITKNKK
jgi:hypothetical protein